MSVVQPLLSTNDLWNLSSVAHDAREEAFRMETKEAALKELETFMEHAQTKDFPALLKESLKENGGRYGEVELRTYGNWTFHYPLSTSYGPTAEERNTTTLGWEIENHIFKSAAQPYPGRPLGKLFLHKLFRDTQILPVIAAHIGEDMEVRVKWSSTVETLRGVMCERDAETYGLSEKEVVLAEFKIYRVVAIYRSRGLTTWQKDVQKKALAFYGFLTAEEAAKKAAEAEKEAAKKAEEAAAQAEEEAMWAARAAEAQKEWDEEEAHRTAYEKAWIAYALGHQDAPRPSVPSDDDDY